MTARACVIGAGSSGIAALRELGVAGVPAVAFEKSDRVGGNWVFGNKNGMSAAYRGLYINTSRERMQYASFPMPADYPQFPHHTQIAAYFDAYVDRFELRPRIRFETGVARVAPAAAGGYDVTTDDGATERFEVVLVANGHHWDPSWPDPPIPGDFSGTAMHSHAYVDPAPFAGKRVLVVGMGNSAMDIAVEASDVAARVYLSARRGVHVLPKVLFGKPIDQLLTTPRVPWRVKRRALEAALRLAVGPMEGYGLPRPDHRVGDAHPTISGRILDRLVHGAVTPRPEVARFEGARAHFVDGSADEVDVVVYCTGYKVTFPFFDPTFVAARANDLPLYRRVVHPDRPGLYFVGLLQPLGAIMPLAEAQGRWIGDLVAGRAALPSPAEMRASMERERAAMYARYVPSRRHTMQVDFDEYLEALERERELGRARALAKRRASGY